MAEISYLVKIISTTTITVNGVNVNLETLLISQGQELQLNCNLTGYSFIKDADVYWDDRPRINNYTIKGEESKVLELVNLVRPYARSVTQLPGAVTGVGDTTPVTGGELGNGTAVN